MQAELKLPCFACMLHHRFAFTKSRVDTTTPSRTISSWPQAHIQRLGRISPRITFVGPLFLAAMVNVGRSETIGGFLCL
jgi:hypothetical protein